MLNHSDRFGSRCFPTRHWRRNSLIGSSIDFSAGDKKVWVPKAYPNH
ncbi:MAG: hypothetical protein J6Q60_02410 [Bacteroidaceae bacterium]|nr:hypothetical protein [Bacteroidaceae bacterium]